MAKCSYCLEQILEGDEYGVCPTCKMSYHKDCWRLNKGCGTSGCTNAPDRGGTGEAHQAQWENRTKICPYCQESIPMKSLTCPLCKTEFGTIHTISREEAKREHLQKPTQPQHQTGPEPIIIFILSLAGILSPFILFFGGSWYFSNREHLKKFSPAKNMVALTGLCLSVYYVCLITIGIILFN